MSAPDAFDRVTTRIGDLDHPFYDEERQRDVWNEASAVGFQLLLWGLLTAAAVAIWIDGRAALPYVTTMAVLAGVGSTVAVAHAARRGIDLGSSLTSAGRWRVALAVAVVVGLVVGLLRSADVDLPTILGMVTGAAAVGFLAGGLRWLARRRRRRPAAEED